MQRRRHVSFLRLPAPEFRTSTHTPIPSRAAKRATLDLPNWEAAYGRRTTSDTRHLMVMEMLHGELPPPLEPEIVALTSLYLKKSDTAQHYAVRSWLLAGLRVVSFNHPSEVEALQAEHPNVEFVTVPQTGKKIFGRHYSPIAAMLKWATDRKTSALLINSDIVLSLTPAQLHGLRERAADGLAYFVRHNHNGNVNEAAPEAWGIDAFLMSGTTARGILSNLFVMGQPAWDWWLPHMFMRKNLPLYAVAGRVAFHERHPFQWAPANYKICADELARIAGTAVNDVRVAIDRASTLLEVV